MILSQAPDDLSDDYWNAGYGRIIMVPRVKLAYDKVNFLVSPSGHS